MADSAAQPDNWSAEAYQNAAAFVPKLTTKVVEWLDVQPGDRILDIGCGDGVLTNRLAASLTPGGSIHGLDASPSMIATALATSAALPHATYAVADCSAALPPPPALYTKAFSNAALHWILRAPATREAVFRSVHSALAPGGTLVFEMGGQGNVAEVRAALLAGVGRRVGLARAKEADPWFFPDEEWMAAVLRRCGFEVLEMEREYRPTRCEEGEGGGVEGWLRIMGKSFFEAVGEGEREGCVREVREVVESVVRAESGGFFLGYVRLRVKARKI